MKPTQILMRLCKEAKLDGPYYQPGRVRVGTRVFTIPQDTDEETGEKTQTTQRVACTEAGTMKRRRAANSGANRRNPVTGFLRFLRQVRSPTTLRHDTGGPLSPLRFGFHFWSKLSCRKAYFVDV